MKFCKDCKWYDAHYHSETVLAQCSHPSLGHNPISGSAITAYCSDMRRPISECGKQAKLFEQKVSFIDKVKGWFGK